MAFHSLLHPCLISKGTRADPCVRHAKRAAS
jgi:hypothetical protein